MRSASSRIPEKCLAAAFGLAALASFHTVPARGQEVPRAAPCFGAPDFAVVTAVNVHGDLVLGPGGRKARLADISLPEAEPWRRRAIGALNRLIGEETAASLAAKPDRWGLRRVSLATAAGDLAAHLVANGLAIVNPVEAQGLCNPGLLDLERKARNARTGLWADSGNRPVHASDTAALLQRDGRFTLVYGRILSVGVRQKRVYLNFGRDWSRDFTATLSSAIWERIREKGVTAGMLEGRYVRLRGVIREWRGPSLEIQAPEMLEMAGKDPDRT